MRAAAALAVLLVLAGCDSPAEREARLARYVGLPEVDLVRELGPPSRTIVTPGHRFLAYTWRKDEVVPPEPLAAGGMFPFARGFGYVYPARVTTWACERTFEIVDGKVAGATQRGNYC